MFTYTLYMCVCVLLVATYALQKMNTQKHLSQSYQAHWTLNFVHYSRIGQCSRTIKSKAGAEIRPGLARDPASQQQLPVVC